MLYDDQQKAKLDQLSALKGEPDVDREEVAGRNAAP